MVASKSLKVGLDSGDSSQHLQIMPLRRPFGMRERACRSPHPMRQIWVSSGNDLYGYSRAISSYSMVLSKQKTGVD